MMKSALTGRSNSEKKFAAELARARGDLRR